MSSSQPGWLASDELRLDSGSSGDGAGTTVVRRLFCVGMAGTGVKAIAEWFAAAGWQVIGTDRSASDEIAQRFESRGMRLHRGHSADHLSPKTDLLIYSPAVPEANPERRAAAQLGIPQWSYPQALGQIMRGRDGISIAGTHGKSTTTALVGHVLRHAGLAPSILCGAEMVDSGLNGVLGGSDWGADGTQERTFAEQKTTLGGAGLLVAESCEYRGHFWELSPRVVGVLGIEPDHFDCFPTLGHAVATYREFVQRMPVAGVLVANLDCAATCSIVTDSSARKVFVSTTDERADFFIARADSKVDGLHLSVRLPNRTSIEIPIPLWGQHHAINVGVALAIAREYGVTPEMFAEAATSFAGIRRRFERRGDFGGRIWVDDYAHHPTAVRALINAARDRFPQRRVWCLFQPHQISRTRELASGFIEALCRADGVLVYPVFGAREAAGTERRDLSRQLAAGIQRAGTLAHFAPDLEHTWTTLETLTRPGDVVLTVGAGDIDRIYHEFTGRLRQHYAS